MPIELPAEQHQQAVASIRRYRPKRGPGPGRTMNVRQWTAPAAALLLAVAGCRARVAPDEGRYAPGLGEIMGQNQVRHGKLWFAGHAANWPLASYELDELAEGFGDAAQYHPTFKTAPDSLPKLIAAYIDGPLATLRQVVARRDSAGFPAAFDALTAGCNGCHTAAGFGFNVVQRPTSPPFTNQAYAPASPPTSGAPTHR